MLKKKSIKQNLKKIINADTVFVGFSLKVQQ